MADTRTLDRQLSEAHKHREHAREQLVEWLMQILAAEQRIDVLLDRRNAEQAGR